jgi:hypothetical protein
MESDGTMVPRKKTPYFRIKKCPIRYRPDGMSRSEFVNAEIALRSIHGDDERKIYYAIVKNFHILREKEFDNKMALFKLTNKIAPNPYRSI